MSVVEGFSAADFGMIVNERPAGRDTRRLIAGLDKAPAVLSDLVMGVGGGPCSLVKGAKSLTEGLCGSVSSQGMRLPGIEESGTSARLSVREWSGEYRLRCVAEMSSGSPPPAQSGDRYTDRLSARGAEAIQSSCDFMVSQGTGYKTFLTLTLSEENRARFYRRAVVGDGEVISGEKYRRTICKIWRCDLDRERIEGKGLRLLECAEGDYCAVEYTPNYVAGVLPDGPYCEVSFPWELSLSREVSRFANSINAMRRRGWVPRYRRSGVVKVNGQDSYCPVEFNSDRVQFEGSAPVDGKLPYLWVAECPTNADGAPNPHIHLLMSWSMPWRLFPAWAKRIESIWALGFAKIEKIRDAEKSAYYIAKAAGYLSKGQGASDQGLIRGNRYGMASVSRAPGWQQVGVWSWGVLGHIIEQARLAWLAIVSPMRVERGELELSLSSGAVVGLWARRGVLSKLHDMRKKISRVPVSFGKYSVIFKTREALSGFVGWASECGWSMSERPSHPWLAEFRRQLAVKRDREVAKMRSRMCDGEWKSLLDSASHWLDRWDSQEYEWMEA